MEENTKTEQSLELDEEQLQVVIGAVGSGPSSPRADSGSTLDPVYSKYLGQANAAASIAAHGDRIGSPLASAFADLAKQHAQVVADDIQHVKAMDENSRNRAEAWKIVQQQKKSKNPFTCCFKG
jgi:hypothetical protein